MRIFVAVRHSLDPRQFHGGLWSSNFYPALRRLGHELVESQVDLLPCSRFMAFAKGFTKEELAARGAVTEAILDEAKKAHAEKPLDLFLSYFYVAHFDPQGFDELARLGIPTVNFYCNSIYQFELVAPLAARVQWSWHAERDARMKYQAVGARPVWVQMGADPQVYRPVPGLARERSACFMGQRYADRDLWVQSLIDANVPIALYGQGWGEPSGTSLAKAAPQQPTEWLGRKLPPAGSLASYWAAAKANFDSDGLLGGLLRTLRQRRHRARSHELLPHFEPYARGRVPDGQIHRVFSEHEIVLNFSNVWADGRPGSKLIPHVRLRDFEAPMCRSCFLTGYSDEIEEFFEVGREIDAYETPPELIEKIRYYLDHPESAEALREAGYRRALRDHTWDRRFTELFAKIGLKVE